jgi:hypothetical protein
MINEGKYLSLYLPIAKSIDLFGNLVYSVSCERACGVVWSWLAHISLLDPL